jgi:hypothetical protein
MSEEHKSLDILGVRPIANAIDKTVQKSLEGIESFLLLVCKPALGEVGLLVQDKVRYWRLNNVIKMLEKAKGKLNFEDGQLELKSNPRVGISIIENSSFIDNDEVQEMWAGLFASSCTEDGKDDENLIFVDILKQLTTAQAQILKFGVENTEKIIHQNGLVTASKLEVNCNLITKLTGLTNYHRIDRELDYLISLGLINSFGGGFKPSLKELIADISPSYLTLSLYIRTQGSTLNPDVYWETELILSSDYEKDIEKVITSKRKKIVRKN